MQQRLLQDNADAGAGGRYNGSAMPLQIVRLDMKTNTVEVCHENLATIGKKLRATGADAVSIISIMGKYRSGKSFLLDMIMRYLSYTPPKIEEAKSLSLEGWSADQSHFLGGEGSESCFEGKARLLEKEVFSGVTSAVQGLADGRIKAESGCCIVYSSSQGKYVLLWHRDRKAETASLFGLNLEGGNSPEGNNNADAGSGNADLVAPGDVNPIGHDLEWTLGTEAKAPAWFDVGGGKMGFHWQAGMTRCTEGIWLWSEPFVFPSRKKGGKPIAVMIMDTQGAWDSGMTQKQSASVFGLTSLLSSKLIYNMKGVISENEVDNLDYFVTFAQQACSSLPNSEKVFGELKFLCRDWENYEDGNTYDQCVEMMKEHLDVHLSPDHAPDEKRKATLERLRDTFRITSCFGLPHPGKKVPKPVFKGSIEDIDNDFIQLVDRFIRQFFKEDFPIPSAPLGFEITTTTFEQVVINFAEAFATNEVNPITLREGYVKCAIMKHRDDTVRKFKQAFERDAPDNHVVDPEILSKSAKVNMEQAEEDFRGLLREFKLPPDEQDEVEKGLIENLQGIVTSRERVNQHAVDGAQMKIVLSPVVGLAAYILFYHVFILGGVVIVALGLSAQANKVRTESETICAPQVFTGVLESVKNWFRQRYIDIQAMQIAAMRCSPTQVMTMLSSASAANPAPYLTKAGGSRAATS